MIKIDVYNTYPKIYLIPTISILTNIFSKRMSCEFIWLFGTIKIAFEKHPIIQNNILKFTPKYVRKKQSMKAIIKTMISDTQIDHINKKTQFGKSYLYMIKNPKTQKYELAISPISIHNTIETKYNIPDPNYIDTIAYQYIKQLTLIINETPQDI